jgi:hypothetical protein
VGADQAHDMVIKSSGRRFCPDDPGVKRLIRLFKQTLECVEVSGRQRMNLRLGEGAEDKIGFARNFSFLRRSACGSASSVI